LACNSTELGFIRYEPSVRFITVGTQETDMRDSDAERQTASRRDYLRATGGLAAAGAVGLAGCMGGAEATTGTLATQVSDQPGDIDDFESCLITIAGFWVAGSDAADEATDTATSTATGEETDREYHDSTSHGRPTSWSYRAIGRRFSASGSSKPGSTPSSNWT
jgi:hypothetical protein